MDTVKFRRFIRLDGDRWFSVSRSKSTYRTDQQNSMAYHCSDGKIANIDNHLDHYGNEYLLFEIVISVIDPFLTITFSNSGHSTTSHRIRKKWSVIQINAELQKI